MATPAKAAGTSLGRSSQSLGPLARLERELVAACGKLQQGFCGRFPQVFVWRVAIHRFWSRKALH